MSSDACLHAVPTRELQGSGSVTLVAGLNVTVVGDVILIVVLIGDVIVIVVVIGDVILIVVVIGDVILIVVLTGNEVVSLGGPAPSEVGKVRSVVVSPPPS